ncbi:MAG: magnesium/cobalt transporter CorA [Bacteroidia bacterium]|nr:magnesium/cobalt transporter CorA [Bacteroidia bacterium]
MSPSKRIGLPPGTIVYTGNKPVDKVCFTLMEYDECSFELIKSENFDVIKPYICRDEKKVYWLNIDGIQRTDILEEVGKYFQIHPLTLEDIANVNQRPKMEEYENYVYAVMKMIDVKENKILVEQLSLVLLKGITVTFQEDEEFDVFESIRSRIEQGKGRIRRMREDYLFYALMDTVVDTYFHVAEYISDKLEELEEEIFNEQTSGQIHDIYETKREILYIKKQLWPVRDMISSMVRTDHPLIGKNIRMYIRDIQDHMYRIIETIENERELTSSILEVYLSQNSHRMNEIMKVLTLVSSLFIPVTFVVGVYGMNFDYMPELRMKYGYFTVWAIMLGMIGLQIYLFRKKKWI